MRRPQTFDAQPHRGLTHPFPGNERVPHTSMQQTSAALREKPLVIERHEITLVDEQLELLSGKPPLRRIEEAIGLTRIPRHTGDRQARALPHLMVVDLGDRAGDTVRQLRLHRPQVHALLLQRVALREEELKRVDADETLRHGSIEAVVAVVRILFEPEGVRAAGRYGDRMSRITVLALAAAALALVVTLPTRAAAGAPRTVFHYGDSLTVGTGVYLPSFLPGWSITESASISRHADEGPGAVRSLSASLPRVLVISLGTNDDPSAVAAFAADVHRIATTAGHGRCVIWSTVVRPPYHGVSYEGYNRVLRRTAVRYANFKVFDWQALAKTHARWFGRDGVHPTAEGYRARAAALAKLITSC